MTNIAANNSTVQNPESDLCPSLLSLAASAASDHFDPEECYWNKNCTLDCDGLYWAPMSSLNIGYICQTQQLNCVAAFGVIILSAPLSEVGCDVKSLILKCYRKMVIYMFQGSRAFFIRSHCCDNQVTSLILWNILMQILCEK